MEDDDLPPMEDVGAVDAPAEDVTPQSDAAQSDAPPSVEDIAARMGWSPQDQWRGDPAKWKPAHEFVAATAEINSKVTTKLKTLEEQLSNISRTNAMMVEQALAEQRQKLLQERQEAFEVGDSAKFNEVDQKLNQLPQAPVPVAPEVQDFVQRNASWWQKDQEATAWAINRGAELAKQGITSPARQAAIVEREIAQMFPEYAPQPAKPAAKPVALTQPGARTASARAKTFADLPKEAQEAAIYFEKKGVSREQYVKTYFEGDA